MVYAWVAVWIWNKNKSHKPMYGKAFCFTIFTQSNSLIAKFYVFLAKKSWVASVVKVKANHIPHVANLIETLVTRDVNPVLDFFHIFKKTPRMFNGGESTRLLVRGIYISLTVSLTAMQI